MKKVLLIVFAAAALLSMPEQGHGQIFKRKKAVTATTEQDTVKRKADTKYDKLFKGKSYDTAQGGFMTLYKFPGGKLYIEVPVRYLGREMMLASTVSEVSDPNYAAIGYKIGDPVHFKLEIGDSTILMKKVNADFTFDQREDNLRQAMKITTLDPIIHTFKYLATNNDDTAVVFDAGNLFVSNNDLVPAMGPTKQGSLTISPTFNSTGSYLTGIKAFEDNVSIRSTLNYTLKISMLGMESASKPIPFTLTATRTILLLPEDKMRPRIADSRIGIFLHDKYYVSTEQDYIQDFSVTHRWKVEPADPAAYGHGELVEPAKPIVFYVDNTFPELWKEPVRKGALRWNAAFEKIGFRNVIQVRDFPTAEEDPEFDPDNLKYSCIRYIPNTVSNAMGPSWVDPQSGEIINASVLIFNDVANLVNKWRFIQTAQVDPRVRSKKLPDDVLSESLEYIVAHEIGHTLGFMHNMSASAAIPVDSLRSPSFTAVNGTTMSIMDYARFNYVAQPGDKGVKLTPPQLGAYDYFLVKWLYEPIAVENYRDEVPVLESWLDEKAGDPVYRYGKQQVSARYDPSAIEEDLGDDPIKASDYGIANLKYINEHLDEWITDDPDYKYRASVYENMGNQFYRYVMNVMYNIGGIYLTTVKDGTPGKSVVAVPREVQKRSLKWCVEQLRNCDWLDNPGLRNNIGLRVSLVDLARFYTGTELVTSWHSVPLSSHVSDDPYTLEEYAGDMHSLIWKNTLAGRRLGDGDKALQTMWVSAMIKGAALEWATVKVAMSLTDSEAGMLPSVDEIVAYGLDPTGTVAAARDLYRAMDEKHGRGFVASQILDPVGIGTGYAWQPRVNQRTVNNAAEVLHGLTLRTKTMLEGRIASAPAADRAHYQSMLHDIEKALDKSAK